MSESDYGGLSTHRRTKPHLVQPYAMFVGKSRQRGRETFAYYRNRVSRLCAGCPPDIAWELPDQNL